jgi:hypothetical protein
MIDQLGQALKGLREDLTKCNEEDKALISAHIDSLENELAYFTSTHQDAE